jgi:rare lipoprotein A
MNYLADCMRSLLLYKSKLLFVVVTTLALLLGTVATAQAKEKKASAAASRSKRVLYGLASFYANNFNGKKTASGEIFSQGKLTCACNVLPLGTWIKVTNMRNGRSVIVKTNDRLHPRMKRIIDLTRAGATKLGYVAHGLTRVKVEVLGKKMPKLH